MTSPKIATLLLLAALLSLTEAYNGRCTKDDKCGVLLFTKEFKMLKCNLESFDDVEICTENVNEAEEEGYACPGDTDCEKDFCPAADECFSNDCDTTNRLT